MYLLFTLLKKKHCKNIKWIFIYLDIHFSCKYNNSHPDIKITFEGPNQISKPLSDYHRICGWTWFTQPSSSLNEDIYHRGFWGCECNPMVLKVAPAPAVETRGARRSSTTRLLAWASLPWRVPWSQPVAEQAIAALKKPWPSQQRREREGDALVNSSRRWEGEDARGPWNEANCWGECSLYSYHLHVFKALQVCRLIPNAVVLQRGSVFPSK